MPDPTVDQEPQVLSTARSVQLLVVTLGFASFVAWCGYHRYAPPSVQSESSAHGHQFDLKRAKQTLQTLVGDGVPHPAGTEANKLVRQRIIDFLEDLELDVQKHETSNVYWRTEKSIPLVNLIVEIPGSEPSGVVAVASHYDSSFGTPGASDDGVGVAVSLEIARHFSLNQPKNDVVILITDGEEMGLLGAEKFVAEHPVAKEIDVIINLEARGTSGPSLMFETGKSSLWSIQQFASTSERPFTSSLFYEIYKLLPNDTDFTRFREGNMEGFNFAFIGDVKNYHTPDDNFETVNWESFQHQGDNAHQLISRLANSRLSISPGRAIYFDFFGYRIFYWPESWVLWLGVISICVFGIGTGWILRQQEIRLTELLLADVKIFGFFLAALGLGVVLDMAMALDGQFEIPWPYNPIPRIMAFWLAILAFAGIFSRMFQGQSMLVLLAIWKGWMLLLFATVFMAAGASYLFQVPIAFMLLGMLLFCIIPKPKNLPDQRWLIMGLLGWAGVCLIWLAVEPLYYDALGFRLNLFLIFRVALVMSAILPLLAMLHGKVAVSMSGIAVFATLGCWLIGRFGA